jgi:integrase
MARRKQTRYPNTQQLPSGKWRFRKVRNKGRPNEVLFLSRADYASSEAAWLALQQRIQLVDLYGAEAVAAASQAPTFGELAQEWISVTAPATVEASTVSDYKGIVDNHLKPALGDVLVTNLTKKAVITYLQKKLLEGLAPSTVNHHKGVIARVMDLAEQDGLIPANPARALGRWSKREGRAERTPKVFAPEQVCKLLETCREHWPGYADYLATMALTGLRTGEAAALLWEDIDLDGLRAQVRRSYRKGVLSPQVKTPAGRRRVPLYPRLATLLQERRLAQKKERLAAGLPRPRASENWVFTNGAGGLIDVDHFRARVWLPLLEKAELPARRLHDLRHTYVSTRIKRGEDLAAISRDAGHANLRITLETYAHFIPAGESKEMPPLDELFLPGILPYIVTAKEKGPSRAG